MKKSLLTVTLGALLAPVTFAADFGSTVEHLLHVQEVKLFGIVQPLERSADARDYVPRASATAGQRQLLAKGLKAEFVTRMAGRPGDMISFWPTDMNPTHLMVCIEGGRNGGGTNPSVQRIDLETKAVETVLSGMSRCDGIRTTAWGTVLATEESGDGRAYEIINPLSTTGHWVADRSTGDIRTTLGGGVTSTTIAQRPELPTMAWEGLTVLPTGVVIGGEELRPGSGVLDTDGGSIFKFVPDYPLGGPVQISDLDNSPLISGSTYAMQVSCSTGGSFPQYGQGCEVGIAGWVQVDASMARIDANDKNATGYYRPEDLHADPTYGGDGVRFCWTNTGNEGASHYGEILCAIDDNPMPVSPGLWEDSDSGFFYLTDGSSNKEDLTTVVANRFVEGDLRFTSPDNLAFQPHTGIVYVIEDHQYGEVWACLPDGADQDLKTDG
jgi:hypothetical protein